VFRLSHRTVRAAAVVVVVAAFALPVLYMVAGALRPPGPPPRNPLRAAWPPTAEAFGTALELVPLVRMALNSMLVAIPAAVAGTVCASWVAFAVVRARDRERSRATGALLVLLMVPVFALWLPRFLLFRVFGVLDTYVPLLAPALIGVTPFTALLCLWSFRRVPPQLWEFAELEGASGLQTWWRIGVPLTRGTHLAAAVIAFSVAWGELVEPLLYLVSYELYTLPLGLRELQQLDPTGWPVVLAGASLATLPVVIGFAAVQRWFVVAHEGGRWLGR
jgi:multiple sugar transport system permease protein